MSGLSRRPSNKIEFDKATGNRAVISRAVIPELGRIDLGGREAAVGNTMDVNADIGMHNDIR